MRKTNVIETNCCFDNDELRFEVDKYSTYVVINRNLDDEKVIEIKNEDLLKCVNFIRPKLIRQLNKAQQSRIDYLEDKLNNFNEPLSDKKCLLLHKKYRISMVVNLDIFKQLNDTKYKDYVYYSDDIRAKITDLDFSVVHNNYKNN